VYVVFIGEWEFVAICRYLFIRYVKAVRNVLSVILWILKMIMIDGGI